MRERKRRCRRKKNQLLKRVVSIVAILVLCITSVDLSALSEVFAEETSGYKLEIEYSQDYSSAVIKGDSSGIGQNIQLVELSDEKEQTYDVENFQYPVEENGEYCFGLTYYENVEGNLTEKEESLKVQVGDIVKKEAKESALAVQSAGEPEAAAQETEAEVQGNAEGAALEAEGQDSGIQEEKDAETVLEQSVENQQTEVEGQTSDNDFPDSLPIATLKANAARLMAADTGGSRIAALDAAGDTRSSTAITVKAVTKENQIALTEVGNSGNGQFLFKGGVFSEDTVSIKQYNEQREFYRAIYVKAGVQHEISAVYPYANTSGIIEWYYVASTVDTNGTSVDQSQISVGRLLPDGAEIWVEYGLDENATAYNITVSGTNITSITETGYWKVSVPSTAKHKEKVVLEFNLPTAYEGATVEIRSAANSSTIYQSFSTEDNSLTLVDSDTARYSGVFDMPAYDVDIHIEAIDYTTKSTRYYGLGIDGRDYNIATNEWTYSLDITMKGNTGSAPTVDWEYYQDAGNPDPTCAAHPTYKNGSVVSDHDKKNYYDLYGNSENLDVAWGRFTVGEDVEFDISYGVYQAVPSLTDISESSRRIPMYLRIDSYPNMVSQSEEVCELIEMPSGKDESVTQSLSNGAVVTIRCNGYRTSGQFSNTGSSIYSKRAAKSYFSYSVTVSNMKYAFKAYINSETELTQTSKILNVDEDSIVIGSGTCATESKTPNEDMSEFLASMVNAGQSDFSGSFWVGDKTDTGGKRYIYPVTDAQSVWTKWGLNGDLTGIRNGHFEFYIQVKEGYSQPTIDTNGGTLNDVETRNGYFYYTYDSGGSYPSYIDISAKPITFNITYRDGKGKDVFKDSSYTPATTVDYPIKNILLDSPDKNGKYFQGWRVEYKIPGQTQNQVVDETIYNSGDVLDLQDIYAKMLDAGYITDATAYEIYIVGQWGDRKKDSQVQASYNISKQKISSSTADSCFTIEYASKPADISELQSIYTDENFDTVPSNVAAYEGTTARLTGYKTQMGTKDGKKYLLSPDSIEEGEISDSATFAQLVYMSAVNVQFITDAGSYGNNNTFGSTTEEINAYNAAIADRYYIPATGYTIYGDKADTNTANGMRIWALELYDSSGDVIYDPGDKDGKIFSGWKVKTSTNVEWVIDGSNRKWLNLYDLATQEPELWNEAVGQGTITLEPVWVDAYGEITAKEDGSLSDTNAVSMTSSEKYEYTTTFYYSGSWDDQKAGFNVKLFGAGDSGDSQEWYSYSNQSGGAVNNSGVNAKVSTTANSNGDGGIVTVTFTIPASKIQRTLLDGKKLKVYAWNDKNNVTDSNSYDTNAANIISDVKIVPKKMSLYAKQDVSIFERTGYQIVSQFEFDMTYYTLGEVKQIIEDINNGKSTSIGYAVYYKSDYYTQSKVIMKYGSLFDSDSSIAADTVNGPQVQLTKAEFKDDNSKIRVRFIFQVGSTTGTSGSIDMNHNGSQYYIACWNDSNVTAANVQSDIESGTTTYSNYSTIQNTVTWQTPSYYVSYPSGIFLEDGKGKVKEGVSDVSEQYAGQKVTIQYSNLTSTSTSSQKVPTVNVSMNEPSLLLNENDESKTIIICDKDGTKLKPGKDSTYSLGVLEPASEKRAFSFWMNTLTEKEKGQKWTGTAEFIFSIEGGTDDSTTP